MIRIYDAAFAAANGSHHAHLGTFWWINENSRTGQMSRQQAYNYLLANPNTMYVKEGNSSVLVFAYYDTNNPATQWIQTAADGVYKDNLTALAVRHRRGLPNL